MFLDKYDQHSKTCIFKSDLKYKQMLVIEI